MYSVFFFSCSLSSSSSSSSSRRTRNVPQCSSDASPHLGLVKRKAETTPAIWSPRPKHLLLPPEIPFFPSCVSAANRSPFSSFLVCIFLSSNTTAVVAFRAIKWPRRYFPLGASRCDWLGASRCDWLAVVLCCVPIGRARGGARASPSPRWWATSSRGRSVSEWSSARKTRPCGWTYTRSRGAPACWGR